MITAKNNGGSDFEPIEAGNYVARCYQMIHLGTSEQEYLGEKKMTNKVRISFELPTETKVFKEENGEQPYSLGKDFTLSMHEKATLRKFLESWRGKPFTDAESKGFDITKLLGVPCMINVVHQVSKQGKKYAEIVSISPLPKGMTCLKQVNPNFEFSFEPFESKKFEALPQWLKDKISKSEEYKAITEGSVTEAEEDDKDSPF